MLIAMASGQSTAAAARAAGVSERTAFRRLADPDFRAALHAVRSEQLQAALGQLLDASSEAVSTLRRLMMEAPPATQLGAARAILEFGPTFLENVAYETRLRALEEDRQETGG